MQYKGRIAISIWLVIFMALSVMIAFTFAHQAKGLFEWFVSLLFGILSLGCLIGLTEINYRWGLDGYEIKPGEMGIVLAIYPWDYPKKSDLSVHVRINSYSPYRYVEISSRQFEDNLRENFAELVKVGSVIINRRIKVSDGWIERYVLLENCSLAKQITEVLELQSASA